MPGTRSDGATGGRDLLGPFRAAGLSYCVRLPTARGRRAPHPVLCFLHGRGESALHIADMTRAARKHGPLHAGASDRSAQFIVVFPQLAILEESVWREQAGAVQTMIRRVQRRYRGDRRRTYLAGFSFGADGALIVGPEQSQTWAALWPVDPPGHHVRQSAVPIWLWYGTASPCKYVNADNCRDLELEDARIARGNRRATATRTKHVPTATAAFANDGVYAWLLRQRLPAGGYRVRQ